ncbi:MAG: UDP-3-O-(3-hydroxymyristoyl)glucosamine N-acyltransferase [Planctomycetota bacterium]
MSAIRFMLSELTARVDGSLHGDGEVEIFGLGDLRVAGPRQIAFVRDRRFEADAMESKAGALLVSKLLDVDRPQIVVASPDAAFARIAQMFFPLPRATKHEIDPTALVDPSAELEEPVRIGPGVVVGARTKIGAGSVLEGTLMVEHDVVIGRACVLRPNVTVRFGTELGDRVVLNAGVVVGSDGFGYAPFEGTWERIPQLGTVQLADDVEVGANSAIDRATLGTTRIHKGVKIDNLVHIGHNCQIGEHTIIAAYCALSGSVTIGAHCVIAGHVVFSDHISIPDHTQIGGASVLTSGLKKPGRYLGWPIQKFTDWGRTIVSMGRVTETERKVRRLEAEVEKLREARSGSMSESQSSPSGGV